ncbi:MAG: type VI secretion system lipoprotein TssJ [Granulosicoccus sp.]
MQGTSRIMRTEWSACARLPLFAMVLLLSTLSSGCSILQKTGILPAPAGQTDAVLPTQTYEMRLILSASKDLNPDAQSRPSPVQVRLFLANPQSEIATKSFEEMFDFDGNIMDPRPLATITLRPDQTKTVVLPATRSQTLLVIAAAYRDPYQSIWSAIAEISPKDVVNASATIGSNVVTIDPTP